MLLLSPQVPPQAERARYRPRSKQRSPREGDKTHCQPRSAQAQQPTDTPPTGGWGRPTHPCQGAEQHQFDEHGGGGHRPVSLAEHEARIHRVKVPFHFPACSLEEQRDSQHTLPYNPSPQPSGNTAPRKELGHLTSSMNSQGWQAPPSRDGFFNPCSNMDFKAGQSVPRTKSVTPSVTESSPAMEY